jgi:hypothetical protein
MKSKKHAAPIAPNRAMDPDEIRFTDLIPLRSPEEFKLHLATSREGEHPLNVYVRDREAWIAWNERKDPNKNDWTRPFILSFIEFLPLPGTYLFGGAFEFLARREDGYELSELSAFSKWEGRLVCKFTRPRGLRGRSFYLENLIDQLAVHLVLPERYDGGVPG